MSIPRLLIPNLNISAVNSALGDIARRIQNQTTQGTLPFTYIDLPTVNANLVFAGPDIATFTKAEPDFRALTSTDIPSLDAGKITTGKLALARGGTHADLSATGGANQVLKQSSAGADITVGTLDAASIATGQLALARGGTNADLSGTGGTSQFLKQASAGAAITVVRPTFTDLSDYTAWAAYTATRTAGAGTWTVGTVNQCRSTVRAKLLFIDFSISLSSVSNVTAFLAITIPAGLTTANLTGGTFAFSDNGTVGTGYWQATSVGGTTIRLYMDVNGAGTWAVSATNTSVVASMALEIQ